MTYNGCTGCQNYLFDGGCPAFPNGIPLRILSGETIHDKVLNGQETLLVWQARTPERDVQIRQEFASYLESKTSAENNGPTP
jgi:hypothetical protein